MTRTRRLAAAYIALAAAVAVLFALNLFWGSVSLAPGAVLTALLGKGGDALAGNIILQLRLPRAVMAALLGAALSAAGYLLQTFFANPIAGPFVMGVSSGAKLAVALTMVVFLDRGMLTSSATMIAAAFAGAMASTVSRHKSGWSPGRNMQPKSSGTCSSSAERPSRTVSFRPGRSCSSTGTLRERQSCATSSERVTTMRAESFGVSVAANARHSIGSPQNGARSLLEPKRWLRPDAMMTQPTGRSSFI